MLCSVVTNTCPLLAHMGKHRVQYAVERRYMFLMKNIVKKSQWKMKYSYKNGKEGPKSPFFNIDIRTRNLHEAYTAYFFNRHPR